MERNVSLVSPYKLYPYQKQVVEWMKLRETKIVKGIRGALLCMTMGLGKSLLSAYTVLSSPKLEFPTLIVCSKTILYEWKSQVIDKFFPKDTVKALYLHPDFISKTELSQLDRSRIKTYDFVFTTYDVCLLQCNKGKWHTQTELRSDDGTRVLEVMCRTKIQADLPHLTGLQVLYGTPWGRIIADESQRFANPSTKTSKSMMALYGDFKWCLTGTPIRNTDVDLFAQLRWLGYNEVCTKSQWKRLISRELNMSITKEVVWSMGYHEAGITMPDLINHSDASAFGSKEEYEMYQFIFAKTKEVFNAFLKKLTTYDCVLVWFLYLRLCTVAPYLLTNNSKRKKITDPQENIFVDALAPDTPLYRYMHLKEGTAGLLSTKMRQLRDLVIQYTSEGKKVLIFSMFTRCLDLIADVLDAYLSKIKYEQLIGECSQVERQRILTKFRTTDQVPVLLLNYKVGGEGINLTCAEAVIFCEPWWNDAVHSQARSRAWRLGQTKPVDVHYLFVKDTVEDHVFHLCLQKLLISKYFFPDTHDEELEAVYTFDQKPIVGGGLNREQMRLFLQ
jgi:SNF2 family DNA or RNA helicase